MGGHDATDVHVPADKVLPSSAIANDGIPRDLEKEREAPQTPIAAVHPQDFPDGGSTAWLAVLSAWSCTFASFGWISTIGVFQAYYSQHQLAKYSPSTISWILSMEAFLLQGMAPLFGYMFDNHGPRNLLLFGTFMHVVGLMMASLGKEYYQLFLAQGVCSGIGASALFYGSVSTVSTWFFKKRALAIGIVTSGASTGGLILPIVFNKMIDRGVSFGWTMRTIAFIFLALLLPACAFCKSSLDHVSKPFDFERFIHPYKEPAFRWLIIGSFCFFLAMYIPAGYIILYAEQKGMSASLSGYLIAILNSVSIIGRISSGWMADRFGRFNMAVVIVALSAILVLGLWIPANTNATIIAFSAGYGLVSGAFIALIPAMCAQLSDIREIGVRQGTLSFNSGFASLIGNPIGGALLRQDNGGFLWLQIFSGVALFVAGVFLITARAVQTGVKLVAKV